MRIPIPYDTGSIPIDIPDANLSGILTLGDLPALPDPQAAFRHILEHPLGTPPLLDLLKAKGEIRSLVVIVSDRTRQCLYPVMLPILVDTILRAGVKPEAIQFIIACGTHKPTDDGEQDKVYGAEIISRFPFTNHDCRAADLVDYGFLSTGLPLKVNHAVANADVLITTGQLNTHYFAGFSGGRKAILPGVSAYETIQRNHSQIMDPRVDLARLDGNPIHEEMQEAALKVGIDFNLNVVLNQQKKLAAVFAGELVQSFRAGTDFIRDHYSVPFDQPAEVVVTSPGGIPQDRSLYHTQKCLNNTMHLVKDGGTMVVFAPCREGVGQKDMVDYLAKVKHPSELLQLPREQISIGGHRAVATAKLLEKAEILLITEMPEDEVRRCHFGYMANWETAWKHIIGKHGTSFRTWVVPDGTLFYPVQRG
jgi:nickel-dependent lactate racemase